MKILIYLFLGLGQFVIQTAGANDSACFSIHDPDRKNVCLAMSKNKILTAIQSRTMTPRTCAWPMSWPSKVIVTASSRMT